VLHTKQVQRGGRGIPLLILYLHPCWKGVGGRQQALIALPPEKETWYPFFIVKAKIKLITWCVVFKRYCCTWGDPKIPGIVKKNYLKYLYKFEYLVPFEVLPLRLDAAIPAPLPMLETLSKIFNGSVVKGCHVHHQNK